MILSRDHRRFCSHRFALILFADDIYSLTIEFDHQSSGFCIEQKKNRFMTSIRKSNASWNDSSKHESECSRSRFKQNMMSSLRWTIFKRNSKKMWSQLIRLFSSQNLFDTPSWKDLASLRSSSIRRQRSMSRATWIDESRLWMIWCRFVLCKRAGSAKSVEDEKFELSKVIQMMQMRNVSWTSSRPSLSWNSRFVNSFHWDANLISAFIVLAIALYLWTSDSITLIVNSRCNDILIAVIRFGQVSTVLVPIPNVLPLRSTAWCISRIMRPRCTEFTCSRRYNLSRRENFNQSMLHLAQLTARVGCNIFILRRLVVLLCISTLCRIRAEFS